MSQIIQIDEKQSNELAEREGRIERAQRNAYYEIGLELKAIRDSQLYKIDRSHPVAGRYSFTTFEEYVEQRWDMQLRRCNQMIEAAEQSEKIGKIFPILPSRESHVRELLKLESDEDRAAVWKRVVDSGETVTAKLVEAEREKYIQQKNKDWLTLDEWKESDDKPLYWESNKTLNKQDNDSIEWAQWSWNPITGCKHDCSYCYARDIANRFYVQKFEPSIYPGRMSAPANTQVPEQAKEDTRYRNIFTGSMADIFGRWVPAEWIESVLNVMRDNPQWNFLTLTKFPNRLTEFEIPENAWMGTSVDLQARVNNAEKAFSRFECGVKWLSIEPMIEPLKFNNLDVFDWVVIGGASASTQTPAWNPPYVWIEDIVKQCRDAGVKVYFKTNLLGGKNARILELPFDAPIIQDAHKAPEAFHYLGKK